MKYSIDQILLGVQAHREEQIAQYQQVIEKLHQETTNLYHRAEKIAPDVHKVLQDLANQYGQQAFTFDADFAEAEKTLYRLRRDAPSQWTVEHNEKQIKANTDRIERLNQQAARQDSDLEVFLRVVKAGGETTVSQYAIRQAGLKNHNLGQYAMAYSRTTQKGQ